MLLTTAEPEPPVGSSGCVTMTTLLKALFASTRNTLDTWQSPAEFSRFNDARLRDIGLDRAASSAPGNDLPWQVAEQGGTGAKVHLHIRLPA